MELAGIGAMANGGVHRLAASPEDKAARDLFRSWCEALGLPVRVDAIGNMFARREGRDPERKAVLIGSHLDTQPVGGKFDGTFGVLAALEAVRRFDELGLVHDAPIEIVNWTNEEGCRFQPSSLGAEVASGHIALREGLAACDDTGTTLGESLRSIGYAGEGSPSLAHVGAYLEAHIEQGPILEGEGRDIGLVEGSVGINAFQIKLVGREAHTGTTPIDRRQDALYGAARCITDIRGLGLKFEPDGRATVARLLVEPNARSVVASEVRFTADCRHREGAALGLMTDALTAIVETTCAELGLQHTMELYWSVPPRRFDHDCLQAIDNACETLGLSRRRMTSGAGHDAIPIAARVPTAMIFVPSRDGISHHQDEYTSPAQLAAGCDVLMNAAITLSR
jgi:beta-ureidopropionase / N-carbamoyl-L-amino-acid hydrolase